jgi:hypothetical protein
LVDRLLPRRRVIRESAGTSKAEAKARLKDVHRQLQEGLYLSPAERTTTVDDLLEDLVVHLENKGIASLRKVRSHLRSVREDLGHVRAAALDTRLIEDYQRRRVAAGGRRRP